ncbi:hypothetical protein SMC26_03515 [Actinomadura fulvescens]|uniref:hypothetical protein n=1 Tax=Actinomadura fulvescens TaxID=46160 RepID=UPI0031DA94E4
MVVTDLLRRVAQRTGHRPVTVTRSAALPVTDLDPPDVNVPDFEIADPPADAIQISSSPGAHLVVDEGPHEWINDVLNDPLAARLAWLRLHHRAKDTIEAPDVFRAEGELGTWRALVAEWATTSGRPINRAYVSEAEAALSDDLDSPTALAVLDRLIADPDLEPGAKLETVIHLDLLLALDLVRDIGRA